VRRIVEKAVAVGSIPPDLVALWERLGKVGVIIDLQWNGEPDFAAAYWLHELDTHPDARCVSDGDPAHITFPRSRAGDLAPRFGPRARPY
jgi:hypothetical protein